MIWNRHRLQALCATRRASVCVAGLVAALAGCGDDKAGPGHGLSDAARVNVVGQWQGRSEDGRLVVSLSHSPEGTYDWRQTPVGTQVPHLAHTGRWNAHGEVATDGSGFTLLLHCETIHFGADGILKPGDHTVSYKKLPDGVNYRAETPWGVFILEHVPEA